MCVLYKVGRVVIGISRGLFYVGILRGMVSCLCGVGQVFFGCFLVVFALNYLWVVVCRLFVCCCFCFLGSYLLSVNVWFSC